MPETNKYHQGSSEITPDGAFVPEAPDDRTERQRQLEEEAKLAAEAHAIGQTNRPYEVRQSAVQADLGGMPDPHPELTVRPRQSSGWNPKVGLIDSDGKVRALIADDETAQRAHAAVVRSGLDDDDRKRNQAGIEAARNAIPDVAVPAWDRSHVVNQGDEVSPALQQVGDDELRRIPNSDSPRRAS